VGRPSTTGGVSAQGSNGIQYDFMLEGVRYRPTLKQIPTEANLRHAREHVKAIKERIRPGTFSFGEEFPDFRDLHKLVNRSPWRTCNQVFDEYLQQCESRLAKHDLSLATVVGYRKVLDSIWRLGQRALPFLQVRYSTLVKIAGSTGTAWSRCGAPMLRGRTERLNPTSASSGRRWRVQCLNSPRVLRNGTAPRTLD
jgi:hypothetical protein